MKTFLLACLCACVAFSQGSSNGRIDGTVTDPAGAAVPAAQVTVTLLATDQTVKTITNDRGEYAVPSLTPGTYRVTVTSPGFKAAMVDNVALTAGGSATVPIKLEIGQATESVTVSGGAEIVQATTADVTSTITGRQLTELPFATRNAVELMLTQPGTQTPTNPRSSSINGLPKGAINITIDGMNTQDSLLKSSDGFFSYIMPSVDALEEATLTTSAGGVDSTAQGAAQIKFVTKGGTNSFHGGGFWQVRNTFFNANYYYNNETRNPVTGQGLPRDIVKLNQYGGHVGGPIVKDKVFFFTNYERYRLPGTKAYTRNVLTDSAINGNYTYKDSGGTVRTVNLYSLAAAGNNSLPAGTRPYATTPDPILLPTYQQIAKLTGAGSLTSNIPSNDYNTNAYNYQPNGNDQRDFFTTRLDYNVTQKHHLSLVYNYNKYVSIPDFLNNVVPIYAGTGTVLGSDVATGQRSNRFATTLSMRSALSARLTNEVRGGFDGGTVLFFDAIGSPALFSQWKGYIPSGTNLTVTSSTNSQRRNSPVQDFSDTLSWVKGSHQISVGGNFDQVNLFNQVVGTSVMPQINFAAATGDPIITGASAIFSAVNLPGSTTAQQTAAANLYSSLTGRVNTITRSVVLDENTHQYGLVPKIDRDRLREYGLFAQDTWRIASGLTLSAGLRYEKQLPWDNVNKTYTQVTYPGLWGVSGVGNLFQPGTLTGSAPVYTPVNGQSGYKIPPVWAPSLGLAWQLPAHEGVLGWLTGKHQGASVIRVGYSISTVREGSNVFTQIYGTNQGLQVTTTVSNNGTPADFGPAGSVLFRDPTLPVKSGVPTSPVYPIAASFTDQIFDFNPNLKMGYVQSWNLGWQRELGKDSVVEFRYTGNHGVKLWRLYGLNETNIFENGFLNEFKVAQNNLAIARGGNINNNLSVINFGNQGLPGQGNIPILQTAIGASDSTTAQQLMLGQAGSTASAIATNSTRMASLTKAGYPVNLFLVNPSVGNGNAFVLDNQGSSFYDAFQIEFRRRISRGFTVQGSYAFSKSLVNGSSNNSVDNVSPVTMRNLAYDKVLSPFDIRHGIKLNWIYELPFGQGRAILSGLRNPVARKALEGWELAGVARLQSGTPFYLNGLGTFNSSTTNGGDGVILHNITQKQLQDMVGVYKTTDATTLNGVVFYLPPPVKGAPVGDNFITNTQAAFNQNGLTPAQVDPNKPYMSPAPAGTLGWRGYFDLPWQRHFDVSLVKITKIHEKANLEIRAQALNVFNMTNFLPDNATIGGNSSQNIGATFGQIGNAYRDISGTVDPGGRILEFVVRINF